MELLRLENDCSELRLGFLQVFFVGTMPVAYRMAHSQMVMAREPEQGQTWQGIESWAGDREVLYLDPDVVLGKIVNLLSIPCQKQEVQNV